jgi:hypothetical protein
MKPILTRSAFLFAGGLAVFSAAAQEAARPDAPQTGDRTRLRAEVVYTDMSAGIIRVRELSPDAGGKHDERAGAAPERTPTRLSASDVTLKVEDKAVGRMESLRDGDLVELTCRPGPSAAVNDPATLPSETLPDDSCAVVVGIGK